MKKILLSMILVLSIISCDTLEEDPLYTENSPEYDDLIIFLSEKCIKENSFFTKLDEYADFTLAPYKVNNVYVINQDNDPEVQIFAKILDISATDIKVAFNSGERELEQVVNFNTAEYANLVNSIKTAACNKKEIYTDYYSFSGLKGTAPVMTWKKETIDVKDGDDAGSEADQFRTQTDKLTFDLDYPLFFYFYNGTKTQRRIVILGNDADTSVSKITVEKINESDSDECSGAFCSFPGAGAAIDCNIIIDPTVVDSGDSGSLGFHPFDLSFIDLDAAGCEFLESNI